MEEEGRRYEKKLSKVKCEVVYTMRRADIHFADGTSVQRKAEAKYLGCMINDEGDLSRELGKRISTVMVVMKRLNMFTPNEAGSSRRSHQVETAVRAGESSTER